LISNILFEIKFKFSLFEVTSFIEAIILHNNYLIEVMRKH